MTSPAAAADKAFASASGYAVSVGFPLTMAIVYIWPASRELHGGVVFGVVTRLLIGPIYALLKARS